MGKKELMMDKSDYEMDDRPRYMELSIPQEILADTSEIIEANTMEATIVGRGDEEDSVMVGFNYAPEHRKNLMEIIEMTEDYYDDDDEEEEEEPEQVNELNKPR